MALALGAIPDAINSGLYAVEGDFTNSASSLISAVPVIGQGNTARKYVVKAGDDDVRLASREQLKEIIGEGGARSVDRNAVPINAPGLSALSDLGTQFRRIDAKTANIKHPKTPPYTPRSPIYNFSSNGQGEYVRYYNPKEGSEQQSSWLMRKSDVVGLTPEQITEKFSIEHVPTHVTDVVPPAGTSMRTGVAGPNFKWSGRRATVRIVRTHSGC